IQYDFNNHIFQAGLNVGINYNGVTGNFPSELYMDPVNWHVYIGTPLTRGNLTVLGVNATSYFMVGTQMLPTPLSGSRDAAALASAQGFACGAELYVVTDKEYGLLGFTVYGYANFTMGFDVMMTKGVTCANGYAASGINGWYLRGNVYASFNAAVGIKRKKLDVNILTFSASAQVYAELMDPSYVCGYLDCNYSILAGSISGSFNYDFQQGTACIGGCTQSN
ncbi:MAG: hypothetical protein V4549_11990, partial [Bacteroidota bacterium]